MLATYAFTQIVLLAIVAVACAASYEAGANNRHFSTARIVAVAASCGVLIQSIIVGLLLVEAGTPL